MKIAHAGDRALLVEIGDVPAAQLHAAAAAMRAIPGVRACIVGQSSLYVVFDGRPDIEAVRGAEAAPPSSRPATLHRIAVSFRDEYGPDLRELLSAARITRDAFLDRVARVPLTARYVGFRGGFAYLDGWPAEWAMPRRPTSRPRVPRGTFAVAGSVAAFYPIDSPGGWNLLGRTARPLEHAIAPGDEIRLEPMLDPIEESPVRASAGSDLPFPLELKAAPLATLVMAADWSGIARGVPPGGPFDEMAAASANRSVGNDPGAPLLECALAGPEAIAREDRVCSWFGAEARIRVDDAEVPDPRQFDLAASRRLRIGRITGGMRGYLAAGRKRGEVDELRRGDRLTIRAAAGPHDAPFREMVCEVTPQLDRVGIRMRVISPAGLTAPSDLPSCGMQCGTVQLHPDGSVVAMGPDHPVTGGYLQPMTVNSAERWKLAQLVPGERVRFVAR
ncbi:MAG TPA: carboxyltransferase domain-containing protein [Thermoanaerobaculia bacterium]|nr:carboxyltransferase domain-containing protein [Thermoanaerobaculia bacterium]